MLSRTSYPCLSCFVAALALLGCGGSSDSDPDASVSVDATTVADASGADASATDAGPVDALAVDATPATLMSIQPATGFYPGGLEVTVTGSGFDSAAAVFIGGEACTNVSVTSDTTITCNTPSGAVGAADVTVSAAGGNATLSGGFTYLAFTRVDTIAGDGTQAFADGTGDAAQFSGAVNEIVVVGTTAYVTDGANYRIRSIDLSGLDLGNVNPANTTVATLAGNGTSATTDSSDGTGATASFLQPEGIAHTGGSKLIVTTADWALASTSAIREVDMTTGDTITRVSGLVGQGGVVWPGGNSVYVGDCGDKHNIQSLDLSGNTLTDFVGDPIGSGDTPGMGADANFYCPFGLAMNEARTKMYTTEWENHRLKAIDVATVTATRLAGDGIQGYADNADGSMARFEHPSKVSMGGKFLFVTDLDNCRVRQVDVTSGAVTTVAGSGTCTSVDGALATATLQYPNGIFYDPRYGIFVTSSDYDWRPQAGDAKIRLIH